MLYKELLYDGNISRVRGIQFCIMSPEDIKKRSVAQITRQDTYAGNEPVPNGLFDSRMGVIDRNRLCRTCEQKDTFCPGHFGHIVLAKPVFYIQFFDIVKKLLRCVCFRCSKILVDVDSPEVRAVLARKCSRQKRWDAMAKLCHKVKRCGQETIDGCGARQGDRTSRTDQWTIKVDWRDVVDAASSQPVSREQVFSAEDVLRIFRRITDEDADALGFSRKFNRPEWMICTVLPVPPPSVRPSVRIDTGQRSEDDLTHILSEIVKFNTIVANKIEKGSSHDNIELHVGILQYHVATLVDNSIPTMYAVSKDRTGRVMRTLSERLKHKEGRIRGNLMGKRVDFSARTVITPDPNISIDELGVPLKIAMNLTFPEYVNRYNIDEMYKLVRNGSDVYPGAKHVRKASQNMRTIRLKGNNNTETLVLEEGDIVERHLRNGDYVLFNRQPSLHKMSMMAHRVRVMNYNTFRLNVCVCASYNADFDGDEMNLHVPQSMQTHEEIKHLAAVPLHIISPRHSKPIVTIVQDVALGVFRMTQSHVRVSHRQMMNLVCSNPGFAGVLPPPQDPRGMIWTGRQLLSTVFPANTNLNTTSKLRQPGDEGYIEEDHHVVVEDGIIKQGMLNTSTFKDPSRGMVHSIYNDKGPEVLTTFLNNTQKLVCDWLVLAGFSVGVSDLVITDQVRAQLKRNVVEMKDKVYAKIHDLHNNRFENKSTRNNFEFFEKNITDIMNTGNKNMGSVAMAANSSGTNRMLNMIDAGSKGLALNFTQMVACVGQQIVDNKRIMNGFENRTLPHFTKFDDGPMSRGFVENSFISGLTPQEFFFHSMGGRIGLIDTAVRSVTWETPIVVVEDGHAKDVRIGEWIDAHLERADRNKVQLFPEDRNLELFELDTEVYIPTVDESGHVTWGLMTAVTRHDPGERLYKVITKGGREVTVAESKSLLVWQPEERKFQQVDSTQIKVGDCMPVTMNLPPPPVVVEAVDMSEFFPKAEYVHGTEFHKASMLMAEAQGDKFHIPRGWWGASNGNAFTVPYPSKARFQRACNSGRSEVDNIVDGFVYPFHAKREVGIPDKFELDWENGAFIGLFLADGHTSTIAGQVGISKNDPDVQQWVKAYFEKRGMATNLVANTNERGTSYTMFGYSTLLARFLDAFVGKGARNKFVPAIAYNGPEAFVCGVLSGYFSGDGTIDPRGAIASSSVSQQLNEGIAMLCNRLGAFAKLSTTVRTENNLDTKDIAPMHHLNIRAQWGQVLVNKLDLIHPAKNEALKALRCASAHANFVEQEDVVLDPIVSIEILGVADHPKLYDVTVPSTLNFCIRNGLGTADTSETGYIQRKLIKAMEDCKVAHDLSVRNAAGHIIQFLYGEDGMDSVKLEYHKVPYMEMEDAKFRATYLLSHTEALRPYLQEPVLEALAVQEDAFQAAMQEHYQDLLSDRRFLITHVHDQEMQNVVVYPINVQRITENTVQLLEKYRCDTYSDLDPLHVLQEIRALCRDLVVGTQKVDAPLAAVLFRCYLSPKVLLCKHRVSRLGFERIIQQIRATFYASLAQPGEMVGIVAAQSIGEPTTQMSQLRDTNVFVLNGSSQGQQHQQLYKGEIGQLIDGLLEQHADRVIDLGGDSVVLDLTPEDDLKIIGVSNDEKTSWKHISQVSRHPANGGMVRIHTRSGKTTCATLSHSFLKRTESGIDPVLGSDLKVGDRVPVAKHIPVVEAPLQTLRIGSTDYQMTRQLGWFFGAFLADGSVNGSTIKVSKVIPEYQDMLREVAGGIFGQPMKQYVKMTGQHAGNILHGWDMSQYAGTENTFGHNELADFLVAEGMCGSFDKRIPAWVYASNLDFIRGVIGGYFDGDGNANDIPGKQMIRSASVSEALTQDFIVLLAYVGIFASKCVETHVRGQDRANVHTIQIARKHARRFKEEVGMVVQSKAAALDNIIAYVDREDAHSAREEIDMIPELGEVIAAVGKALELPGQSRLYGRYLKKEAIGRETLRKFLATFEEEAGKQLLAADHDHDVTAGRLAELREHLRTAEPNARRCIPLPARMGAILGDVGKPLFPRGGFSQYYKLTTIGCATLERFLTMLTAANAERRTRTLETLVAVRPKLDILRQAAYSDVVWDEIVRLEITGDPQEYVYDFTVPGNDSFMVDCGVLVHNTLNTFHLSGVSSASGTITQGVPRLRELFHVSRNIKTPAMNIYVSDAYSTDQVKCAEIMSTIQTTRFRDVVKSSKVYFDPHDAHTIISEDRDLLAQHRAFADVQGGCDKSTSPWVLRFELDRMKMLQLQVPMTDVHFALLDHHDDALSCVFSDDNAKKLVCRVRLVLQDSMDKNDVLTEMMALEQTILDNVVIKGVKRVEKAVLEAPAAEHRIYDPISGTFINRQEWRIVTSGSNMMDVMTNPHVDYARTFTNDIHEVLSVLGIEAARQALYNELRKVMWMSEAHNVNFRHMALLVDVMTNRGHLVSIDRHGIDKGDIGPLAKCSFETTTDMLIKAGVFCEMDRVNGVSANVILGQVAPCGTGDCDVIMDIDAVTDSVPAVDLFPNRQFNAAADPARGAPMLAAAASTPSVRMPDADGGVAHKTDDDIVIT